MFNNLYLNEIKRFQIYFNDFLMDFLEIEKIKNHKNKEFVKIYEIKRTKEKVVFTTFEELEILNLNISDSEKFSLLLKKEVK